MRKMGNCSIMSVLCLRIPDRTQCAEGSVNVSEAIRREIMPSVFLTAVKTRKFKTSCIGLNLLAPLHPEEAAKHALLPSVLRRGTASYPDMQQLAGRAGRAVRRLYGAGGPKKKARRMPRLFV